MVEQRSYKSQAACSIHAWSTKKGEIMLIVLTPEEIKQHHLSIEKWWSELSWNTKSYIMNTYFAILEDFHQRQLDEQYEQDHPEAKIG